LIFVNNTDWQSIYDANYFSANYFSIGLLILQNAKMTDIISLQVHCINCIHFNTFGNKNQYLLYELQCIGFVWNTYNVWVHKTSSIPSLYNEMPVQSQESEHICAWGYRYWLSFYDFSDRILELFWQFGILELFWQFDILELFWQFGIFVFHFDTYNRENFHTIYLAIQT
jgi:hypothetical protein